MPRRVTLVLSLLLLASLACYSDSPLWPYELTPAPATSTPLPFPDEADLTLNIGDRAYTPTTLRMTTLPEPLRPDLSNKSPQSCTQDSVVEVLYSGITPTNEIYHLVDCGGVVGWTLQGNLIGPVAIEVGDRALTTAAGADESGNFKIEASDPPYREDDPFRQRFDCRVGDTVEVLALTGLASGELYYRVQCPNPFNPVQPNVGWAAAETLFGPVRFQNGERGLVTLDVDALPLTETPAGDATIATCQPDEQVLITDTPAERIEDTLYYEITCEDGTGWASQEFMVGPLPFVFGERVMITVPGVRNSAETAGELAPPDAADATQPVLAESPTPLPPAAPPEVILTNQPGPPLPAAQVGTCADASVTTIQDFAGVEGELYAEITCQDATGWVPTDVLFGPVEYMLDETVQLGQNAVIGFSQRGLFLSRNIFDIEGPSGGSNVIAGACAFDLATPSAEPANAELLDIGYYRSATGEVVGVFYRAQCENADGETIQGWINQDRIGVN
ncbi:MAG: hypothetical protein ACLFTK_03710 [Anaerolineales bacterium]